MDQLQTISEFAASSGLSVKMLRSYAERGLLTPAAVDSWSGYRYYSTAQLQPARLIGQLRKAGVSLAEIQHFLSDPDPDALARWAADIDQDGRARRRALQEVASTLGSPGAEEWERPATRRQQMMTKTLIAGGATHLGTRASNEDAFSVSENLAVVADGLGGHDLGEVASRTTVRMLDTGFAATPSSEGLVEACRAANQEVWQLGVQRALSVGTTVVALGLPDKGPLVALSVGDSRLYRLRSGELCRLTTDHTLVAAKVAAGELTELEARHDPQRSILTRAVGVGSEVDIDRTRVEAEEGDRYLLCTDGLFNHLEDGDLRVLLGQGRVGEAAQALVDAAVAGQADDNVTAVVVELS